ncbi:MAG: hypothetical protein WKF61_12730 [Luteimonas sp.]
MNAVTEMHAPEQRAPVAAPHATHKFKLLLKREFWEHKGGFLWAPAIAGAVFLVLTLLGMAVGQMALNRGADGPIIVNGRETTVRAFNMDMNALTQAMSSKEVAEMGQALNGSLYMAASWSLIVFGFVVFFYLLGCLYDERKDRSVLFWKSMPVSDSATVLSKATSALVVAPLLALGAGIVTMLLFLIFVAGFMATHGGSASTMVFGPASPLNVIGHLLAALPVYVLWALPTAGWLMLCSAWARSKPFLWAIAIPVVTGVFVSWFDLMKGFDLDTGWFWSNIVGRLLIGTWPGSWLPYTDAMPNITNHGADVVMGTALVHTYLLLGTTQLWIGAIAGAAMIFGAIQLRRRRELAD